MRLYSSCFFTILILFFILIVNFNVSLAQVPDLIIKRSTESPKEGETVKLTLESDKFNLDAAKITWYVDGDELDQGVGRKTFSVTMSNQKPVQVVTVSVVEEGLNEGQAQAVLEVSGDILLFEGYNSSVPLFYKGRSLPGQEGSVLVSHFSFKDGEITNNNQALNSQYTWKVDGQEKSDLSGAGKNINILNAKISDSLFRVEVLRQDINSGKESKINIPMQNQEILLYREHADKLHKSILKETEVGRSLPIVVEPFFFSAPNKYNPALKYTWKINTLPTSASTPWYVAFSGNTAETVRIELNLLNINKITQNISKAFVFRVE